jgi:Tol biopolymer transport system component
MPGYSPDGQQLAIRGGTNLIILRANGSEPRSIWHTTNDIIAFPAWSPDGTQIVFSIGRFFDRPVKPGQLALIRPDGSGFRLLTSGQHSSGFASWSPDGKQLVFRVMGNGQQGLRILTLATGDIVPVTTDYDTFPVWSPTGNRIAFCSFRSGDFDIYTIRPDGSEIRHLTDSHGNDAHPIWSPDGERIVFSSSRMGFKDERMLTNAGPQPYGELFVMRYDGSEVTQLTDNQWEDATPAWEPVQVSNKGVSSAR